LDLLYFSTPIALGIACSKALLVMLFFMELRHSPRLLWIIVGNGVFWALVMIALTMSDLISRGGLGFPGEEPPRPLLDGLRRVGWSARANGPALEPPSPLPTTLRTPRDLTDTR